MSQDYGNHRKFVPAYHFVASGLLLAALIYACIAVIRSFGAASVIQLLTVLALMLVFWYTRAFALGVQDRVIRLEERLRLERLLPDDLRTRIPELTTRQLIGLRFADDQEVVDLARRVLEEGILDHEEIKRLITTWRPDHCRI